VCCICVQAAEEIKKLYDLFIKVDATQVEINPFGETKDGRGTPLHFYLRIGKEVYTF
jgi:succinyl-CoA synthetase beta subunit